jgi:hypothetical protein
LLLFDATLMKSWRTVSHSRCSELKTPTKIPTQKPTISPSKRPTGVSLLC